MSNSVCWRVLLLLSGVAFTTNAPAASPHATIGRAATAAEVNAWDIDVRPDFAGLPQGGGSVARGQEIWDGKCAGCHGTFGESNEYFNPIVGGTTPEDVRTGVVKSLTTSELQRTTMMKLSSLATLWDYIRRAMPWTAPKSLSVNDVYAVAAYILHLADLVPADFVLSDGNIRQTEQLLPNRNGMTRLHGLWELHGRPDVHNPLCMKDCGPEAKVSSTLPDHARNAHGNLALQNRIIGGVRGADTTRPPLPLGEVRAASSAANAPRSANLSFALATSSGCMACHDVDRKTVGPGFREVAARYASDRAAGTSLAARIREGGRGRWGEAPMPAQPQLGADDAAVLSQWILDGAAR